MEAPELQIIITVLKQSDELDRAGSLLGGARLHRARMGSEHTPRLVTGTTTAPVSLTPREAGAVVTSPEVRRVISLRTAKGLTPDRRRFLAEVLHEEGNSNVDIADLLGVTEKTVRKDLVDKFGPVRGYPQPTPPTPSPEPEPEPEPWDLGAVDNPERGPGYPHPTPPPLSPEAWGLGAVDKWEEPPSYPHPTPPPPRPPGGTSPRPRPRGGPGSVSPVLLAVSPVLAHLHGLGSAPRGSWSACRPSPAAPEAPGGDAERQTCP